MKKFINLNECRYCLSTIKKYKPQGTNKLIIYFNTSRYKIECEMITFKTKKERDDMLNLMDELL